MDVVWFVGAIAILLLAFIVYPVLLILEKYKIVNFGEFDVEDFFELDEYVPFWATFFGVQAAWALIMILTWVVFR
jgi:hypothetical protein